MTAISHSSAVPAPERTTRLEKVGYEAYRILQVAFVVTPIVAGVDKFFDRLADWDKYAAPQLGELFAGHLHAFMMVVGVVEIVAGILVAIKPKVFAYVVAVWLAAIIVNLLLKGAYFDIALRDLGLFLGAVALGRLAMVFDGPVRG